MNFARVNSGKRGERLALSFLKRQGYRIIAKNYRTKIGEIDIIGNDDGCISFIEVRSRNTEKFGFPEETINRKKQRQIIKAALSYIKSHDMEDKVCRFDVVSIGNVDSLSPEIRLIKDAFILDSRYRY